MGRRLRYLKRMSWRNMAFMLLLERMDLLQRLQQIRFWKVMTAEVWSYFMRRINCRQSMARYLRHHRWSRCGVRWLYRRWICMSVQEKVRRSIRAQIMWLVEVERMRLQWLRKSCRQDWNARICLEKNIMLLAIQVLLRRQPEITARSIRSATQRHRRVFRWLWRSMWFLLIRQHFTALCLRRWKILNWSRMLSVWSGRIRSFFGCRMGRMLRRCSLRSSLAWAWELNFPKNSGIIRSMILPTRLYIRLQHRMGLQRSLIR